MDALSHFSAPTRAWFEASFDAPTEVQRRGWDAIAGGEHALLLAPTGSGKTLAAMLYGLDRAARLPADAPPGVRVLYVSPLKALVHDVERNLRAPLAGILRAAERLGHPCRAVRAEMRTGDTPQKERQRQRKEPAEVLVTTPESLFLLLGSRARETLATVETVIVDEVHAVAGQKRGAHLALTLERLAEIALYDPRRIGLSATVRPADEVARFLGGDRPVRVVDAATAPRIELKVVVPVPDMDQVRAPAAARARGEGWGLETRTRGEPPAPDLPSGPLLADRFRGGGAVEPGERRVGVWPAIYPELVELVRAHRSTILFVNSRGLCERLATKLNELAGAEDGAELVLAHHGSVSREQRRDVEERLKKGELKGIVATSSLELGIDMGAVDLVVLVESPGSVARGLQRVGRAGHAVGETSRGLIFPKFKGDLLECAALSRRMLSGEIEPLTVPRNALDVLAQQIVAIVCDRERGVVEIERLVRRAYGYRDLSREALTGVLDMLSGRYPSDDFADLRPRLAWDRARDVLGPRRGAEMVLRMNAGTIPDRGLYHVHVGLDGPRIGELDEEMVYESRSGDVILLGASSWRILKITRDRVAVEPAPGEPGRLPFWKGDGLGRPVELGRAVGALARELEPLDEAETRRALRETTPLDELAAANLAGHLAAQKEHAGVLPTDRRLVVERFRDELGDWRVCILSPFGSRVHAPWALALQTLLSARAGHEVSTTWTDDGIVLSFADQDALPDALELLPDPDELEDLVVDQLAGSALFGAAFRENASRALLIPRRDPRRRTPLFLQRLKSKALLGAVARFPDFPIVLKTYRQCLRDVFDLPALGALLRGVRERSIEVASVETRAASPFARSLVFAYVASYLYEHDQPLAERRTQALTLDRALLRELCGEADLGELLAPDAVETVERELQRLADDRRARDADELFDVLARLGALTAAEARERCAEPERADAWLAALADARRAARARIAGEERWIAAQDAGLYRDALGAMPPSGLPEAFLEPVPDALARLVARFARTHGPFTAREVAARLGLAERQVVPHLEALERDGRLVRGAIRPREAGAPRARGAEPEWCDADVLRRLKRATLALLRGEVAAVDAATLGRFLPAWQELSGAGDGDLAGDGDGDGVDASPGRAASASAFGGAGAPRRLGGARYGLARLREAVLQLEGLALPWSELVGRILPARVPGFEPGMLDELCARGELVWVGRGALGPADGRVALFGREGAGRLLAPDEGDDGLAEATPDGAPADADAMQDGAIAPKLGPLHRALLAELDQRGASFTTTLERAARALDPRLTARELDLALLDLAWAGLVTNDTTLPLARAAAAAPRKVGRGARRARGGDALAGGRWSRVSELCDRSVTATERAHAWASVLLERYGVVAREVAQVEDLSGGFTRVYPVLRAMEEAGRIRRGHFVEGLSGAQFALAGAVDRLRAAREERGEPAVRVLAAVDPASPWGALFAWPAQGGDAPAARPRRAAGASVILVDGAPALWLAPGRRSVTTFAHARGDEALALAFAALARLSAGGPRRPRALVVERIDGVPAERSEHRAALERAGFVQDYKGFLPDAAGRA